MNTAADYCIYCNCLVDANCGEVPPVDDGERWQVLAQDHRPDCEWIITRAHRINQTSANKDG